MKHIIHNACICICMLLIFNIQAFSQETKTIQITDASTSLPIFGVGYSYADVQGISDTNGIINIQLNDEHSLYLSHISFGQKEISHRQIEASVETITIDWQPLSQQIYPVEIVAMHKGNASTENYQFTFDDKLAHDAAMVLDEMPSISSIKKGAVYGFDPVIRGFKFDQVNIVLNGTQCATAACPNRMDPPTSQMTPNMIQKIEVVKGPHALRYGNSLGATINFVPEQLSFSSNKPISARASAMYESNGNIFRTEASIGYHSKRLVWKLYSAYSESDDYTAGNDSVIAAKAMRYSFGSSMGIKLNEKNTLELSATRNEAKDVEFPALMMDLRKDVTWMLNAKHAAVYRDRRISKWETSVYSSMVDHLMDNLLKDLNPRMVNAKTPAKTQTFGGRSELTWRFLNSTLYTGIDYRNERAEGTREREFLMGMNAGNTLFDNAWQKSNISRSALFGEYVYFAKTMHFKFAGRLELNESQSLESEEQFEALYDDLSHTQLNPSVSIGAVYPVKEKITLSLWLARAQRSASLTERYINYFTVGQDPYEMLGNPELEPETNYEADIVANFKNDKSNISVSYFTSYLNNFIGSEIDTSLNVRIPSNPGVRQYKNLKAVFKTGGEVDWQLLLFENLQQQVSLSYTFAQDMELEEPLAEVAPLEAAYRLKAFYFNNKLVPEIDVQYAARQERISEAYGETKTPDFAVLNMKVSYSLSETIHFSGGIKNVLNTNYYQHLSRSVRASNAYPIYEPGRSIYLVISIKL
jgi:iron complex outermembrane receptor protein